VEPLADLAREAIARPGLPVPVRWNALTILSGWGEPADVVPLLRDAVAGREDDEGTRLRVAAAERIVRRALAEHAAGRPEELQRLDVAALLDAARPLALRCDVREDAGGPPYSLRASGEVLVRWVLLASRRLGRAPDMTAWLGRVPRTWPSDSDTPWVAAAGDARALEVCLSRLPEGLLPADAAAIGRALGLCGDDALTAAVGARLGPALADGLERGLEQGRRWAAGDAPELEPDADSRLDHLADPVLESVLDLEPSEDGTIHRSYTREGWGCEGAAAAWIFSRLPARRLGGARGALLHGATLDDRDTVESDGLSYVRLGRFGVSELVLSLRLEAVEPYEEWTLRLFVQMGARRYLPSMGRAVLDVLLDGEPVVEGLLIGRHEAHPYDVVLPADRLDPGGDHELRLLLERASTTTLRVHAVALMETP
jgi:hypothetical protein